MGPSSGGAGALFLSVRGILEIRSRVLQRPEKTNSLLDPGNLLVALF
jgi:hypothetical protein